MMNSSYIAGFCDGDGSIHIGKCNSGYQLKVEFTQCNMIFIKALNGHFDNNGKIYTDSRTKYVGEQASSLRFCGHKAKGILHLMAEHAIIKAPQARLAIGFLDLINKPNMQEKKEAYYQRMKSMNNDKMSYEKDYSKINNAYIAGLFDAEGNVYISKMTSKFRYYVKITQKSDAVLISEIRKYLQFGNISASEPYRIRFMSKQNVNNFHNVVKETCVMKLEKLQELVSIVNGETG